MYKIVVTNNICFNIDSDEELARLQANDPNLKVLTAEQIKAAGMEGYEAIVSPENTTVAPNGTVTFTAPDLAVVKQERVAQLLEAYEKAKYEGTFTSSEGFPVKVDDKLSPELTFLLLQFNTAEIPSVPFIDANGAAHDLTKEQLRTVIAELNQYTSSLAATKAALEAKINSAATYAEVQAIVIDFPKTFTPAAVVLTPDNSGGINEKTSGPMLARALEWVGGTDEALNAGAINDLAKSEYTSSTDATVFASINATAWVHDFTGTGDVTQKLPNITDERDGFLMFIRNKKTSGIITLTTGGAGDTIDGEATTTVLPGYSKLLISSNENSLWTTLVDTAQHESKKPLYIESDSPVVIPDGWHRVVLAFQDATGIIRQELPDLSKTVLGAHMQVRNIRKDDGLVLLQPKAGQTIDGKSTPYELEPGCDVFLLSEADDWFVWQEISHNKGTSSSSITADGSTVTSLKANYPLEVKVSPTSGVATFNINPSAYEPALAPGIYAALDDDVEVEPNRSAKIPCEEIIVSGRPFVYPDKDTKSVVIQDTTTYGYSAGTPFVVIGRVVLDQTFANDTDVTVRLWNNTQGIDTEQVLTDINGRLMSVTKSFKAGEKADTITVEGIVLAKQIENIGIEVVHNSTSDNLIVRGRVREGSCLVAQAITPESRTGLALQAYEQDFNKSVFFEKKYFDLISDLAYWASKDQAAVNLNPRDGMQQADGYFIDNLGPVSFKVENKELVLSSSTGVTDYFIGYEFNKIDTSYLHGHDIDVEYVISNPDTPVKAVVLKWTDKNTKSTAKKVESRTNDVITWANGWTVVKQSTIDKTDANTKDAGVITFTVPYDAENIAVGFVPNVAQNPNTFVLSKMEITTTPFYEFEMAGTDVLRPKEATSAIFELDAASYLDTLRYTLPASFVACPPGVLKSGTANITVNKKVNLVKDSDITADGGAFTFGEDYIVNPYIEVNMGNETNTDSVATFQLFEFDNTVVTPVQNCSVSFNVPANSALKMYRGVLPTFTAKAGKTYGYQMKSTVADGAYIQANGSKPVAFFTFAVS